MQNERNALKAGIFIIISVVLLIGAILMISGSARLLDSWQTRTVEFTLADNIGGLRVGDEVRIGGYKVGSVRQIDIAGLDVPGSPRVIVTFSIPQKYVVRDGARINVETQVTGSSALNIDYLGGGAEMPLAAAIKGSPSWMSQIGGIVGRANGLLEDVRSGTLPKVNAAIDRADATGVAFTTTANEATETIKDVRSKIDPMVEKYHQVGDRASEMMVEIRDLVGDTKSDFRGTVANLNAATGAVKDKLPLAMDKINEVLAKLEGSVEDAAAALKDVRKTAEHTKEIADSARSIIQSNRSRIDAMIVSLKVTGDNLKAATAEIRRSPWRLLYKPGKGEMANLNLFDSARQFAEGANDLSDAAGALRDALAAGQSQEQIKPLVEKLDASFSKFGQIETTLWENVQE